MTFCLGITVDDGLVGIADTRVLSGNECLVARKTATYQGPGFSFFVMTSGLRSLRDKILLCFEEAFAKETMVRERLYKVVNLYAEQVRKVSAQDRYVPHLSLRPFVTVFPVALDQAEYVVLNERTYPWRNLPDVTFKRRGNEVTITAGSNEFHYKIAAEASPHLVLRRF